MRDVLIVTSRNVATPGGEFSLINNRATILNAKWGYSSEIISLCNTNLGVVEGQEAFGKGTYIRRNFSNPAALLTGYKTVADVAETTLRQNKFRAVILSGVGLLRYVDRMRSAAGHGTLICADVHGYYGDGKLLSQDEPFFVGSFHRLASTVERYEQINYLKKFDRIFTVSSAYKSFLCEHADCRSSQFYVVPCGLGTRDEFSDEDTARNRSFYRKKYGLEQADTLLVYSGGTSAWQCLPQTIELFKMISARRRAKLLILSGDREGAKRIARDAEDVLVDSYPPDKLPEVFCAADFFVMLREDCPTNHFAYPNKFLEYAAAHKPTITTPYVLDIAQQIDRYKTGILFDGNIEQLLEEMDTFSCPISAYEEMIKLNSFEETLTRFVADLGHINLEETIDEQA